MSWLRSDDPTGVYHCRISPYSVALYRRANGSSLVCYPRFLATTPGPTAIAGGIYGADMGKTLLYGIILAIPTVIISGPLFAMTLKKMDKPIPAGLYNPKVFTEAEMPGFGVSVFTALIPVILMAIQAIAKMTLPSGSCHSGLYRFLR